MEVARFVKSNLKKIITLTLILILVIINANEFSVNMVSAILMALVFIPILYNWFLELDFTYVQFTSMIEDRYASLHISIDELKAYSKHLVFKRFMFIAITISFALIECSILL